MRPFESRCRATAWTPSASRPRSSCRLPDKSRGKEAEAAASRLAAAGTVADARLEFISVSSELVPKFLEAELPEVHGFMCPAKNHGDLIWAQRSDEIQNPYFGSAMLDCGSEIQPPE